MNEEMNNNVELNDELEQVTDITPVEESKTEIVNDDAKNLVKEVGTTLIIGAVIYAFCKLCDWIVDKVKLGVKKFKDSRKAKKEAKAAQQAAPQSAPVATVEKPVEGQTAEAQQK